jgi:hypothetical protein
MTVPALLATGRGATRGVDGTVRARPVGAGPFGVPLVTQARRAAHPSVVGPRRVARARTFHIL